MSSLCQMRTETAARSWHVSTLVGCRLVGEMKGAGEQPAPSSDIALMYLCPGRGWAAVQA